MPDVTLDVDVIGARRTGEAFGECCGEVVVLCWAGLAGRALGLVGVGGAPQVVNGLSGAVKFVAPLLLEIVWVYMPPRFLVMLFKN